MIWLREWVYSPLFKTPGRALSFAVLCSVAYRFTGADLAVWQEAVLVGMLVFSFGVAVAMTGLAAHYVGKLEDLER